MAHLLHHDQQPQCIRGGAEEADGGVFGRTLRSLKGLKRLKGLKLNPENIIQIIILHFYINGFAIKMRAVIAA